MKDRLELQAELETLLGSDHVYFQPPESIRMKYPCFVYERDGMDINPANDKKYIKYIRYEVMYITKNPDVSDMIEKTLDSFQYITYVRHFVSDSLNHEIFDLYY